MNQLGHAPPPAVPEDEQVAGRNARYGLVLFAIYLLLYGGFMLVNAFWPAAMDATVAAGVNLAVVWGLGLIAAALLLALVYGWLCRAVPLTPDPSPPSTEERGEEREGGA